jgi:hypothetical protein
LGLLPVSDLPISEAIDECRVGQSDLYIHVKLLRFRHEESASTGLRRDVSAREKRYGRNVPSKIPGPLNTGPLGALVEAGTQLLETPYISLS